MIDTVVTSILYFGMFIGLLLVVSPMIKPFVIRTKHRIYGARKRAAKSDLTRYIQRLLATTIQKGDSYSAFTFYAITFAIYFLSLLAFFKAGFSFLSLLLFPILLSLVPFFILRVSLYAVRLESSYEGDIVVKTLLNNYKTNYKNIFDALDETVSDLPQNYYARRSMRDLAYKVRTYRTKEDLKESIMDFNFSIDTQWSLDLSNAIMVAIEEGYDISPSLEDIQSRFIILKEIIEQQKRFNNEGQLIAKWITPLLYLVTVFFMIYYLDFTIEEYIQNQFMTPLGLKFAIYTAASMVGGYALYFFSKKPKNDF